MFWFSSWYDVIGLQNVNKSLGVHVQMLLRQFAHCLGGCGGEGAVSPIGVVPTRTVGASASIIFPCSIKIQKPSLNAAQPYAKAEGRVFLLVPAYPGCPGTKAVKRWLLLLIVLIFLNIQINLIIIKDR